MDRETERCEAERGMVGKRERERDTKRLTFLPYLHVTAAMTGNLAKFSTDLAADGKGI